MDWDDIRKARKRILLATDWTQGADVQSIMSESEKNAWAEFRQKLRDLTKDFETPESVIFPEPPSSKF